MSEPAGESTARRSQPAQPAPSGHLTRTVLVYGAVAGLLLAALAWSEYRFLVVEHSVELYGATLPRITFTSRVEGGADGRQQVVLHFAQEGDLFDIPISMTLQYADRRVQNVLVPIRDRTAEMRVPLTGTLRNVVFNPDDGALVELKRN